MFIHYSNHVAYAVMVPFWLHYVAVCEQTTCVGQNIPILENDLKYIMTFSLVFFFWSQEPNNKASCSRNGAIILWDFQWCFVENGGHGGVQGGRSKSPEAVHRLQHWISLLYPKAISGYSWSTVWKMVSCRNPLFLGNLSPHVFSHFLRVLKLSKWPKCTS